MSGFMDLLSANIGSYSAPSPLSGHEFDEGRANYARINSDKNSLEYKQMHGLVPDSERGSWGPISPEQRLQNQQSQQDAWRANAWAHPDRLTIYDPYPTFIQRPGSANMPVNASGQIQDTPTPTQQPPASGPQGSRAPQSLGSKAMGAVADASKPMAAAQPDAAQPMPQPMQMPLAQLPQFQPMPMQPRQIGMGPVTQFPQMVYSDESLKTNIKETSLPDIDQFIKSLTAKSFDYKDGKDGSHTEGGLMAQDLQKSKIGSSVVVKGPRGLAVDSAKLSPIVAAVMSQKVRSLEEKIDRALSKRFKERS